MNKIHIFKTDRGRLKLLLLTAYCIPNEKKTLLKIVYVQVPIIFKNYVHYTH